MNVGDFSTVFAAQIAAAYPKRSAVERSESTLVSRRAAKEANGREALRPTAAITPGQKVDDDNKSRSKSRLEEQLEERTSNRTETRADVPRRFWESRVERAGSESFRESTTPPNDELGKRLDVFC